MKKSDLSVLVLSVCERSSVDDVGVRLWGRVVGRKGKVFCFWTLLRSMTSCTSLGNTDGILFQGFMKLIPGRLLMSDLRNGRNGISGPEDAKVDEDHHVPTQKIR